MEEEGIPFNCNFWRFVFSLKQPAVIYIVWHHIHHMVVQYKRDSLRSTTQTSTASVRIPSRSSSVRSAGERSHRCLQGTSLFFRSHSRLVGNMHQLQWKCTAVTLSESFWDLTKPLKCKSRLQVSGSGDEWIQSYQYEGMLVGEQLTVLERGE